MSDGAKDDDEISLLDIAVVIAESWIVLIVIPLLAAGLTYVGLIWLHTPQYRAQAVLRLSQQEAPLVTSAQVIDSAIVSSNWTQHHPGSLSDARQRLIESLSVTPAQQADTYSIALTTGVPGVAGPTLDAIITSLIDGPGSAEDERLQVEQRLELLSRSLSQLQSSIEGLIELQDRLASEGSQTGMATELDQIGRSVVSIANETALSLVETQRNFITASDVIQPTTERMFSDRRSPILIAILAGLGVGFVLLIGVFIRAGLRGAASDPSSAAKLDRIRKAFWLPPKHSESP